MMTRWRVLLVLIAAQPAWGQLVFVRPVDESPITGLLDVGTAAPGDILDTRVRLRNLGAATVILGRLDLGGVGFTVEGKPALPFEMAPGVNADFRVRFRPTGPGSYSGTLQANTTTSLLVRGSAPAGLVLLRDGVPVTNERTLEFGTIVLGQRARIGFVLRNDAAQEMTVRQLSVSGAGFSLAPVPLPSLLRAGEEAAFELRCEPLRAGLVSGAMQLDGRSFTLAALAREPEAPDALIELDPQAARSGKQSSLRIRLASPAKLAVSGTLRLEFTPSVSAGAGDAGIQFLGNSSRNIAVQVVPGDVVGLVLGKPDVVFQTGTTAGVAVFRLLLGTQERQVQVTIPPEAPLIDAVKLQRGQGSVEVTLTGFDNHRSAGNVVFTFTDQAGQEFPAVSAEAGPAFLEYFRQSEMGGLFRLTARFPVSGDASKLARVAVRLANGIGAGAGRSE